MIENFYLHSSKEYIELPDDVSAEQVSVIGTPLHRTREELLEEYHSKDLDVFLSVEARESAGNYVIVDSTGNDPGVTIITSPEYCSGYISELRDKVTVATTLENLFEYIPKERIQIQSDLFLRYLDNSAGSGIITPYSTIFDSIFKLKAGYIFEVNEDKVLRMESYLRYLSHDDAPDDIDQYFDEIAHILKGSKPVVQLSGHIDSTSLAVALYDNNVDFSTVTHDIGPGSSHPVEAKRVTDEMGVDNRTIKHEVPLQSKNTIEKATDRMQQDFINPLGLANRYTENHIGADEILINGLNFGAGLKSDMKKSHLASKEASYVKRIRSHIGHQLRMGQNLPFTTNYIENQSYRNWYWQIAPLFYLLCNRVLGYDRHYINHLIREDREVDTSFEGLLRGYWLTRYPNVTIPGYDRLSDWTGERFGCENDSQVWEDIKRFKNEVTSATDQTAADLAEYYGQYQDTAKITSTFPVYRNSRISLPANWGPSIAYFFGKYGGHELAYHPKRELYDYVERKLGRSLSEINPEGTTTSDRGWPRPSALIQEYADMFNWETSAVKESLASDSDFTQLEMIYSKAESAAKKDEITSDEEMTILHHILNTELLLKSNYEFE